VGGKGSYRVHLTLAMMMPKNLICPVNKKRKKELKKEFSVGFVIEKLQNFFEQ